MYYIIDCIQGNSKVGDYIIQICYVASMYVGSIVVPVKRVEGYVNETATGFLCNDSLYEYDRPVVVQMNEAKMNNMYVAGIDSIDIGQKDTSEATKDPSDFCIVIRKRVIGQGDPEYVAYYKDRPNAVSYTHLCCCKA